MACFWPYRSLRDALVPEKSALAQSIRDQLPHPDEAPAVKELFAMVDQDLKQNGQWCGKLGVGKEWVLGDEVSRISRIRGGVQSGGAPYPPCREAHPNCPHL